MNFFARRQWDLPQRQHTSEAIYADREIHRRDFLTAMGISSLAAGLTLPGCGRASKAELASAGGVKQESRPDIYPEKRTNRNPKFEYGREESDEQDTAEFTN